MNLSNQIKKLRLESGFSQEDLAERIYVSRQTISNWETGRSYPDVQSLLLLSVLFDVSLDELVKGDLDMMKKEIDGHRMTIASWAMLGILALGIFLLPMLMANFGWAGYLGGIAILALGFIVSLYIERIKKKHHIKTYSEIVAFMENEPVDEEKVERERKHHLLKKAVLVVGFIAGGLILLAISCWIFF